MIHFQEISEDNFDAIIHMKRPEGEHFVASNAVSLAQAWLYRNDGDVFPLAIYHDDEVVGFVLLEEDLEEERLDLWRIMIAYEYEGHGYGSEAIKRVIEYAKESKKYKKMFLLCANENVKARHIYDKLGFQPTGEICYGDIQMSLTL
ncbi:MAG: GNAT family N-acetyltransferase [Traorella sp.]